MKRTKPGSGSSSLQPASVHGDADPVLLDFPRFATEVNRAVAALVADELVELTLPDKPKSRLQKYRITAKRRAEGP